MLDQVVTFGPYRLDPRGGLTQGKRQLRLTPKAFALLCFLAEHRGRVVTKDELFDALWPRTAVGDAALVTCVQELRQTLRDNARRPRYIETLHRRGYRFVAETGAAHPASALGDLPLGFEPEQRILVGRESELAQLDEALAAACAGKRQVMLVTGEAGIGKTTLVRTFLARTARAMDLRIAWGQAAEHYGATEAYHPVLDALMRSCRGPRGEDLVRVLDQRAPLWLAQMPTLVDPSRLRALQRRAAGATRERMLRELTDALEAAADALPIVLWLEDLHWADVSTVDWLASFARRPESVRLLVIGTYRPGEATAERHAIHAMRDELRRQGQSHDLALGPLNRSAVGEYVSARFTARAEAAASLSKLAAEVHSRTEGSPLFMVGILNELVAKGVLACREGAWSVREDASLAELGIPRDLWQAIDRQIDRLDAAATRLLETASVAGFDFSAATVAGAMELAIDEVESVCNALGRGSQFLSASGTEEWPDGTVASRFSFIHALYREAFYERLPTGRRVDLHRRIGERLEQGYRDQADRIAPQLAMHFEHGRNPPRAIVHFQRAGQTAVRRSASREAAAHFGRGLDLLQALPHDRARDELEAALRLALTVPLIAIHGLGSPLVEACSIKARELCERLGDLRGRFAAHRVFWNHSLLHHPVPKALVHARELMTFAEATQEPIELALAHRALGCSLLYGGEHREADRLLARGIALADRVPDEDFAAYAEHPGMICRVFGAWTKALMGFSDEANRLCDDGVEHARRRDDAHGLAFALVTVGLVYMFQRDVAAADRVATEVLALSQEHTLPQWAAFGHEIKGWAICRSGDPTAGLALMEQALGRLHATGARVHSSRMLANLAEGYLAAGKPELARLRVDAALAHRAHYGEHYYAPELYRLQALVLEKEGAAFQTVEAALRQALDIARGQEAGLLAARAAETARELTGSVCGSPRESSASLDYLAREPAG